MGIYRCPSSSIAQIGTAKQAASSQQASSSQNAKRKGRAAPTPPPASTRAVRKSKDKRKTAVLPHKASLEEIIKEQARTKQKKEMNAGYQRHIFVGSLAAYVTELQLEEAFSVYGTVVSVTLRSAGGFPSMAATVAATRYLANRVYASVEFKHANAVYRVMEKDSIKVRGQKVVIARNALELPEFDENVQRSVVKHDHLQVSRPRTHSSLSEQRRTARKATERVIEAEPQPRDGPSQLGPQTTDARIAHQFRSRANDNQRQHPSSSKATRKR